MGQRGKDTCQKKVKLLSRDTLCTGTKEDLIVSTSNMETTSEKHSSSDNES